MIYSQSDHDAAAGYGCLGLIIAFMIAALLLAVSATSAGADSADQFSEKFASGAYSVTVEDIEREVSKDGGVYPMNGKDTPLRSNTTYGNGAGMVDIIVHDRTTNAQIRIFGQVQQDGTIRWYDAEYVLDENGKPIITDVG